MLKLGYISLCLLLYFPNVLPLEQLTYTKMLDNAAAAVRNARNPPTFPREGEGVLETLLTQQNELYLNDAADSGLKAAVIDDELCRNHTALYLNGLTTRQPWAMRSKT